MSIYHSPILQERDEPPLGCVIGNNHFAFVSNQVCFNRKCQYVFVVSRIITNDSFHVSQKQVRSG